MTIRLGAVEVAEQFLVTIIVWDALVVLMLAMLFIITLRLRVKFMSAPGPFKSSMKMRMAHLYAMALLLTVIAIDQNAIFFFASFYINFAAFQEVEILAVNFIVFFFFLHVETYFLTYNWFEVPDWISKIRRTWMAVNFVGGHMLLVMNMAAQRVALESIIHVWVGLQLAMLGPLLFAVVQRISTTLTQHHKESIAGGANIACSAEVAAKVKNFKRFGIVVGSLSLLFGSAVIAVNASDFAVDWSLRYEEQFRERNADRTTFSIRDDLRPLRWFGLVVILYLVRTHWVEPQTKLVDSRDSAHSASGVSSRSGRHRHSSRKVALTYNSRSVASSPVSINITVSRNTNDGFVDSPPLSPVGHPSSARSPDPLIARRDSKFGRPAVQV